MPSLGDLMVRVGADISGFTTAMKSVIDRVDDMGDKVEERLGKIESVGKRLATIGAEMSVAITLPLEEMGRRALEVAAQFEQTQVAFTTFMGSAQAAQGMLADLYQFAATTPFEVPGVLAGARTLMAMQFAAKDIVPIMRTLGDAASGLGLGQEGLERLVFHLGQIRSEGSIDGRVLRELGMMGINAGQMLADGLGKSVPDIRKMVSEKAIDATTAINALMKGMNEQFGGMMQNQMSTLGGQWSNFKDQITLTLVDIGNTLLPIGKMFLDWASQVTGAVKDVAHWFASLPAPVQAGIGALVGIAAAAGPALAALGGIGLLLPGIMAVLEPLAAALGVGVVALGGWAVAIAAAVAALAALGVWVAQHWDGVKAAVSTAWDGVATIWENTIGAPTMAVIALFELVYQKTAPLWRAIGSALSSQWDLIKQEALSFWIFLKNDILQPMFGWLEKIPGVMKLLSAGDAFKNADADAQKAQETAKSISDAMSTLHLNGSQGVAQLSDPQASWLEKHKSKVEEYTKAVHALEQAYQQGAVSADTLHKAQERLQTAINEKMPNFSNEAKAGKTKVDRNALDELSGERAHEQAGLNMRRATVEHTYQMSQAGASDKVGESADDVAAQELAAARQRRTELDALAKEELDSAVETINEKLKLYKQDQAGYQKLIAQKTAAEDKYAADTQKNRFDEETVQKRVNEQILAENLRLAEQELKAQADAQKKSERLAKQHSDAMVEIADIAAQAARQHEEALTALADRRLEMERETGEISQRQYLAFKQEQFDKAYAMEIQAIEDERALLDQEFADLLAKAKTPEEVQQLDDKFGKRYARLDARQQQATDRHAVQTQDVQDTRKLDRYDTVFRPIQSSFSEGMRSMIEGTKTFGQAWADMTRSMLDSWISSLAQMAARWVVHKAQELIVHVATNQAKVASDASAAAQSNSISLAQHFKEILRAATQAAAKAWGAMVGIPIVGPVIAPAVAAATFAGVMAFGAISAERGAVLPDENTLAFLHPNEMVLPAPLSKGLQSMIASGAQRPASTAISQLSNPASTAISQLSNPLDTGLLRQIAANTERTAQALGAKSGGKDESYSASLGANIKQGFLNDLTNFLGLPNKHVTEKTQIQLLQDIADNTSSLRRGIVSKALGLFGLPFFEDGGIVGATGPAVLHKEEMVLPSPISTGLRNMIAGGGFSMANPRWQSGSPVGGDTHNHFSGDVVYQAAPGEKLTHDKFFSMFQSMLRMRNLKMA